MTARRHISKKMRLRIHADHGGICCFCKELIDLDQHRMEISHRIPLAMGGADEEHNMEPAHYDCQQWCICHEDFCMTYGGAITNHTGPDAAKAAAQAEYERRILSALAPDARVVTAEQLREWADDWEELIQMTCGDEDGKLPECLEMTHIAAMRSIAEGQP